MTIKGSPDIAFLMLGGRDIKTDLTTFKDSLEAVTEETTGLGVSNDTWGSVGVKEYMASVEGFYNTDDEASLEALALTGEQILMVGFASNVIGTHFTGSKVLVQKHEKRPARRAFTRMAAELKSELGAHDGVVSHILQEETGDDETAAIDNGASSADGAFGYLGVTELDLDGGTDIVIKEQDSPDDSIWADLITYDTITSLSDALRSQQKFVAGTVDRYSRTSWAWNGGGAGKTITFATGISRQ